MVFRLSKGYMDSCRSKKADTKNQDMKRIGEKWLENKTMKKLEHQKPSDIM
jgi:hypothetical protein